MTELHLYNTDVIKLLCAFIHCEGSYPKIYGTSQMAGNDEKTMYGTKLAYAHSTCIIRRQTSG
jgi:hypothetical protein